VQTVTSDANSASRAEKVSFDGKGATLTICAFAISVAICSASYLLIEGPLIRMAHRKFSFREPKEVSKDLLTAVNV
jgi:peptidoglycan/LPS O-acetylase OafA/YrhL